MNLKFWNKGDAPEHCPLCGSQIAPGCKHMWSNWNDPTETTRTAMGFMGSSSTEVSVSMQERRCLTCNMIERRYI